MAGECALFVTAHPDDETMFFAPAILSLLRRGLRVALLCLSTGNADGLGALRAVELQRACSLLGLQSDSLMLVDDPRLQDGMQQHWAPAAVAEHVAAAAQRFRPDRVVTFDAGGVSGHPNHRSTCAGVLRWWAGACGSSSGGGDRGTSAPELWQLQTVGLLRKYLGLLDAPLSWALCQTALPRASTEWHAAGLQPARAWRALAAHRSQMVWYRCLWALFACYMYACTLVASPLQAAP